MFCKVYMEADDSDEAIVQLTEEQYEAVKIFLNQVKEQRSYYCWVGGHWSISSPYPSIEQAKRDACRNRK